METDPFASMKYVVLGGVNCAANCRKPVREMCASTSEKHGRPARKPVPSAVAVDSSQTRSSSIVPDIAETVLSQVPDHEPSRAIGSKNRKGHV